MYNLKNVLLKMKLSTIFLFIIYFWRSFIVPQAQSIIIYNLHVMAPGSSPANINPSLSNIQYSGSEITFV